MFKRKFILFLFYFLLTHEVSAEELFFSAPVELSDNNVDVKFEVDSTWVLVKGKTSGLTGKLYYSSMDPLSISSEIRLPIKYFNTGLSLRDKHLREVINEKDFPEVVVKTNRIEGSCSPEILKDEKTCELTQYGTLSIRGITRELKLISRVTNEQKNYLVSGEILFPWAAFKIEDPSNLFAKLKPDVKVVYDLRIVKK